MTLPFASLAFPTPSKESLAARYAAIAILLDTDRPAALAAFDAARREYDSWSALTHLRFSQDTTDEAAKAAREYADSLAPEAQAHETAIKRRLLDDPDRAGLEALASPHTVRLWANDITTFTPAIAADLEEESRLTADYTALLATARFDIDGKSVNLAGLAPYAEHPDRATRHEAERLRWSFFTEHGDKLDALYDQLVKLRHGMALKLGDTSFTALAYRRMRRLDYGPAEVARYREQVLQHVTPLVDDLLDKRRATMGWDSLCFWDEAFIDPAGNPKPIGDHDTLVAAAETLFDRMDKRLADFYRTLRDNGFMDLKNRPGKAGGGFCTSFPTEGTPFIFANFNGTHHDIGVFTHEMGHAFQAWESRNLPGIDQLWPTMESAEIHSMGLEFLTHPQMGLLVGDGAADRFRHMHLIGALAFLPYGVCVDHFQHEVYANPDATPAERHALWQRLEKRYMPWSYYGDLKYPAKGGRWQAKQHIYNSPFYYIDYTLALCCAMQLWVKSRRDPAAALEAYVALCGRGGTLPFSGLVASAGLISPFAEGALREVVREAQVFLAS